MKILFVVTAFYPEQAIGSIRMTKFVKFLQRAGHQVTVLSLAPAPWSARDESLRFAGLDELRWIVVPQSELFQKLFVRARIAAVGARSAVDQTAKPGQRHSWKARVKSAGQFLYTSLKAIDWAAQIERQAKAQLGEEQFDAIMVSYPSLASLAAGKRLKRLGFADTLVTDFRDPITYGGVSKLGLGHAIERWAVGGADLLTFVSTGVEAKVLGAHPTDVPAFVASNGFDIDDLEKVEPIAGLDQSDPRLKFVYVGSLYGGKRDLAPLFAALAEVVQAKTAPRRITLHYAGQEGALFRSQAAAYGLQDCVVDHGRITRAQALGLQRAGDICLMATWNTPEDQGILTGKLFEYFLLRKTVLGIVAGPTPDSEVAAVMRRVGAGYCYEEASPGGSQALSAWLRQRLAEKMDTGMIEAPYTRAVDDYDFQKIVDRTFGLVVQQAAVRERAET